MPEINSEISQKNTQSTVDLPSASSVKKHFREETVTLASL